VVLLASVSELGDVLQWCIFFPPELNVLAVGSRLEEALWWVVRRLRRDPEGG
jgi:hypothetical protein